MTDHERDDYWRVNGLPNGINNLPIGGHPGAETIMSYGESYTLVVRLTSDSDSETSLWPDHRERYERLLETYGPHAGQYTLHTLIDGTVTYTQTHSGPSLLVAVKPPTDAAGRGGYYLVSGVEDATTLPERLCRLEIELVYVADLEEYVDVTRANKFLESEPV